MAFPAKQSVLRLGAGVVGGWRWCLMVYSVKRAVSGFGLVWLLVSSLAIFMHKIL